MSEQQEYSEVLFQMAFPTWEEDEQWVCQFDGANEVRTTGATEAEALKKMILVLNNCAHVNTQNLARLMSQLNKARAVLAEHGETIQECKDGLSIDTYNHAAPYADALVALADALGGR